MNRPAFLSLLVVFVLTGTISVTSCKPGSFGVDQDDGNVDVTPINDGTGTDDGTGTGDGTGTDSGTNDDTDTADGTLTITVIDVGQGNALYIRTPSGTRILVDAGRSEEAGRHVLDVIGTEPIDHVVVSHFDSDHYAGLAHLVMGPDGAPGRAGVDDDGDGHTDCLTCPGEYYAEGSDDVVVRSFLDRGVEPAPSGSEFDEYLAYTEGRRRQAVPGEFLAREGSLVVRVVASNGRLVDGTGSTPEDENARSVAVYVRYGLFGLLVTGDLPASLEQELAYALDSRDEPVTVLVLGHHGSDTATAERTLELLEPRIAVISVGNSVECGPSFNPFGHPAQSVLDALWNYGGIEHILQTEEGGARPEAGQCTPAAGETYPRDYHTMSVVKQAGDITFLVTPTSYTILFSGN